MMQIIEIFKSKNYQITFATACTKTDNAFDLKQIEVQTKTLLLNDSSFDTFIKKIKSRCSTL